jgi:hypothetical protein
VKPSHMGGFPLNRPKDVGVSFCFAL